MESALRTDRPKDLLLIETMGRGPDGIRYLDLHLARLKRGAEALGYPFDESQVRSALADATEGHERIRLTLNEAGDAVVETGHLPPNPPHWTVAIHSIRLTSDDPWLQVKTTNRALYNDARADLPNGVDEWLF
ncbi:MAG: aminotransferase class IV, partial [Marivivens sp.]|nr:aminotransferase class IV [Marivivens sp.]